MATEKVNHAAVSPIFISAAKLHTLITHNSLIHHLRSTLPTFSAATQSPIRHVHHTSPSSSLLLMPSWSQSPSLPYIGIKLVTYHPNNSTDFNLPGIHATYVLFNSITGQTLASIDATELTLYRTSCISALASEYLSRTDSEILVMIGAGSLAPHLIRAHLSVRPSIKKVIIWNRNGEKAVNLAGKLESEIGFGFGGVRFESKVDLEEAVREGDIVSCATNSETPLVKGSDLKPGAHLDLVGSFKHSMVECDDEAIKRGKVYIDNEAALLESGELLGAFERGVIKKEDIAGDLVELINGGKFVKRKDGDEDSVQITVFKSVGSAVFKSVGSADVNEWFLSRTRWNYYYYTVIGARLILPFIGRTA